MTFLLKLAEDTRYADVKFIRSTENEATALVITDQTGQAWEVTARRLGVGGERA